MIIDYKIKNKPAITSSFIKNCAPKEALFFISKDNPVSYITSYNDKYDYSSKIIKTETLKTKFKVYTNTSNILITNIAVENIPYYFEIITSNNSAISIEDLLLQSDYNAVEVNGKIYTNFIIDNYEITDGVFIYSKPVVDPSTFDLKYYDSHILVTVNKSTSFTYYAKTASNTIAEVKKVSNYKIEIPSFYIETRSKVFKIIEGDVVLHNKIEATTIEYNSITPKDKVDSVVGYFLNKDTNMLYSKEAYLINKEILIEYTAKFSSHIYEIDSTLYLVIEGNKLITGNKDNYDICIEKVIDLKKIDIFSNSFINKNKFKLSPTNYGLDIKGTLEDNYKKSLTNYIKPLSIINPSSQVYIAFKTDSRTIFQENFSEFYVGKITKNSILDKLPADYSISFPTTTDNPNKKLIKPISKVLYRAA